MRRIVRNVFPDVPTARAAYAAAWAAFVLTPPQHQRPLRWSLEFLWTHTTWNTHSKAEDFRQWAHTLPGFTAYWSAHASALTKAAAEEDK